MGRKKISQDILNWIEARKRFHLSHAHVQMARELGMNPRKLGKLDNHRQEPRKAPLPQFIEYLYFKAFGKERPEIIMSIEERARQGGQASREQGGTASRSRAGSRSSHGSRGMNEYQQP